jgi:hypothetical protein
MRKHGVFLLSAIQGKRPDAARIGRFVPLSLLIQARNGPQDARHQRPGIKQTENLMRKHGVFLLSAVHEK